MPLGQLSAELTDRFCRALSGIDIRKNVPFAPYTSFRIGGPAALFAEVETVGTLSEVLAAASAHGIEVFVLGGGTNLLVDDAGYPGLVLKTAFHTIDLDRHQGVVRIGGAVPSAEIVEQTIEAGLGGLEFAAGLPGSVGGAIAGNAGCFGRNFSDTLLGATVVQPDGRIETVDDPGWFAFDYRQSKLLRAGAILAEATFALSPGSPDQLRNEARRFLDVRATKHPQPGARTAGSYFKNLPPLEPGGPRRAAGALLDQVGAKSLRVGDAAVFERHANIVVNQGQATAAQVLSLTAEMARRVHETFGVTLMPEVRFVGEKNRD